MIASKLLVSESNETLARAVEHLEQHRPRTSAKRVAAAVRSTLHLCAKMTAPAPPGENYWRKIEYRNDQPLTRPREVRGRYLN